jgi:hypothetical protein
MKYQYIKPLSTMIQKQPVKSLLLMTKCCHPAPSLAQNTNQGSHIL